MKNIIPGYLLTYFPMNNFHSGEIICFKDNFASFFKSKVTIFDINGNILRTEKFSGGVDTIGYALDKLWIASKNGLFCLNDGKFIKSKIIDENVKLIFSHKENIVVCTYTEIKIYNKEEEMVETYDIQFEYESGFEVNGELVLCLSGSGFFVVGKGHSEYLEIDGLRVYGRKVVAKNYTQETVDGQVIVDNGVVYLIDKTTIYICTKEDRRKINIRSRSGQLMKLCLRNISRYKEYFIFQSSSNELYFCTQKEVEPISKKTKEKAKYSKTSLKNERPDTDGLHKKKQKASDLYTEEVDLIEKTNDIITTVDIQEEIDTVDFEECFSFIGEYTQVADIKQKNGWFYLCNDQEIKIVSAKELEKEKIPKFHTLVRFFEEITEIELLESCLHVLTVKSSFIFPWKENGPPLNTDSSEDLFEDYKLLDLKNMKFQRTDSDFVASGSAIKHEDSLYVITGDTDGAVKITKDYEEFAYEKIHNKEINSLKVKKYGNEILIISASRDKKIKISNLNAKVLTTLSGHKRSVMTIDVDKNRIVSGSVDKTVRIWDLDGRLLKTFEGHQSTILKVKFIKEGKKIISGDSEGIIRVWNVAKEIGKALKTTVGEIWSISYHNNIFVVGGNIPQVFILKEIKKMRIQEEITKLKIDKNYIEVLKNLFQDDKKEKEIIEVIKEYLYLDEQREAIEYEEISDKNKHTEKLNPMIYKQKKIKEIAKVIDFKKIVIYLKSWSTRFKNIEVVNLLFNEIKERLGEEVEELLDTIERNFKTVEELNIKLIGNGEFISKKRI